MGNCPTVGYVGSMKQVRMVVCGKMSLLIVK